jgi:hypothetical protein
MSFDEFKEFLRKLSLLARTEVPNFSVTKVYIYKKILELIKQNRIFSIS